MINTDECAALQDLLFRATKNLSDASQDRMSEESRRNSLEAVRVQLGQALARVEAVRLELGFWAINATKKRPTSPAQHDLI